MNSSNRLDIFQIYCRYCEITLEAYSLGEDDYRPANESKKAKVYRDALSQLLQLVESTVDKRCVSSAVNGNDRRCVLVKTDEDCVVFNYSTPVLEELPLLMSRLDLMADSSQFSRFYNFVFFICREDGQRSITVSRAIMAWKLVLSGRFRLLNQWCDFIEKNQRHNISEDTWRQVLAFSRCVHENLEGYDPEGAWPVLIDEFVEHMYRINGSQVARSLCCNCDDSETQPIDDSLPGLKIFPGVKRKFGEDLQDQEFTNINTTIMNTKRRHTDLADTLVNREGYLPSNPTYDCTETVKQNNPTGTTTPPCAVDGSLSKGFAELFSSMSCLQFDRETRVPYTM